MNATELAVIADVHGNVRALEAVLADIEHRGLKTIVNLGDNANGPLEPASTVARLRATGAIHVRGNGDRMTGEGGPAVRGSAAFARQRLDDDALRWLRELPARAHGAGWTAFHGTPCSDEEYFLENIADGKAVLAPAEVIALRLGAGEPGLVLCGHTHIPRLVRLPDGRTVVNPGSVGLPAYRDDVPVPHAVETGSPDARYAVARCTGAEWQVDFICVPYDWRSAAAVARDAGWPEWARHLETGYD